MNISYKVFNPTGNITILVDTPVAVCDQPVIAAKLMEHEPLAEQVGFVSCPNGQADIVLRMAGGEFCGNATMSAAVYHQMKYGYQAGKTYDVSVRVIGIPENVSCKVLFNGEDFEGDVVMPKNYYVSKERLYFEGKYYNYPIVKMGGISHLIIEEELPIFMAEQAIKQWCRDLRCEALGFMMVSENFSVLHPLVYVPVSDTLFWESSCASGSSAVAAYCQSISGGDVHLDLLQPGGVLSVDATSDNRVVLHGTVSQM